MLYGGVQCGVSVCCVVLYGGVQFGVCVVLCCMMLYSLV